MKINFKALNDNLGYQEQVIKIMFYTSVITQDLRDELITLLDQVKTFNDDMIDLYQAGEIELN